MVKRYGYIWEKVCSMENIANAYLESRRGKTCEPDVMAVSQDPMPYLQEVRRLLLTKEYRSGEYRAISIHERGKDRVVFDVDYFPHRIVHWALMLQIRKILMDYIGPHSFAAMKGRGSQQALCLLSRYLKDKEYARYCLRTDVKKYFPSINKDKLMAKLRRKIKDPDVIWLCEEIIYGFPGPGLPIGNYTSQYFANYYFADIYRHMKHVFHCKYILGYMDDWLILGSTKSWLRRAKKRLEKLMGDESLTLKDNWQIFPVTQGIGFVGYRTFPGYRLLKRTTKVRLRRACNSIRRTHPFDAESDPHSIGTLASYHGILKWCNGWRLENETIYNILPRGIWT